MKIKLSKLIERFLKWGGSALADGTVSAYKHQLNKFLLHVKDREVSTLKPAHLTSWAKSWHEWQAPVRLFNWAVNEAELLRFNPFASVKPPPRNERHRVMTPRQMIELLRAAERPGRAYLLALRETYARPQEIRLACWDDLHAEDPDMPIEEALQQGRAIIVLREYKDRRRRKETNRPRILLISKRLGRAILRIWSSRLSDKGPIWLNAAGKPFTNNAVRCLMRRLRKKLGWKGDRFGEVIVAYSFRHSMATLASSKGIKDRLLADLLGHVETRTTRRYQHLDVSDLREALDRMQQQRRRAA
jgi:integrase